MSISPVRPTSPTSPRPAAKPATASPQEERPGSPVHDPRVLESHVREFTPEYIKKHPHPYGYNLYGGGSIASVYTG